MRKSNGFILYEVVLYLLIATTCFSVIYNETFLAKRINSHERMQVIQWHSAIIRMNELFKDGVVSDSDNYHIAVDIPNRDKHYALEYYKKGRMLRVRGLTEGHMPIIDDVSEAEMEYKDNVMHVKVKRSQGKVFEYVHKIEK